MQKNRRKRRVEGKTAKTRGEDCVGKKNKGRKECLFDH